MGVTIKVEYWYLKCLLVRLRFKPNMFPGFIWVCSVDGNVNGCLRRLAWLA